MRQIRNGVFETNSSSTHSICISKKPITDIILKRYLYFSLGEYGWGEEEVSPCDYLYTAIACDYNNFEKRMYELKETLLNNGILFAFEEPKWSNDTKNRYVLNANIDHSNELIDFLDEILDDEDKLLRFLLNYDSVVYTGNDNDREDSSRCRDAEDVFYKYENKKMETIKNPNHDEEKYEYYYKGN